MKKNDVAETTVSSPADLSVEIALAEHAAVIRALGKRVIGDVIEMGRRLSDAKKIACHGGWLPISLDTTFTRDGISQIQEVAPPNKVDREADHET
jgi:hypothetical protein